MAGIAGVFCPLQPAHSHPAVHGDKVVAHLQQEISTLFCPKEKDLNLSIAIIKAKTLQKQEQLWAAELSVYLSI